MTKPIAKKKGRRGISENTKQTVQKLYNEDNMTCEEIAKVCGISRSSVFRIMSGVRLAYETEK